MSLGSARYQLASAFKALILQWEDAAADWRDAVRRDFAEHHWQPLAGRVPAVLSALDRLDQVLAQMKHDCGDTP